MNDFDPLHRPMDTGETFKGGLSQPKPPATDVRLKECRHCQHKMYVSMRQCPYCYEAA